MVDNPEITPKAPNTIEDKAPKPKGVIPKNAQSLVIIGVAVLMILIMWLTGGKKVQAPSRSSATLPPPPVTATDTAKVQAFKQTIQAEQQQVIRQPVPLPGFGALNGVPTSTKSPYATEPGQTAVYSSTQTTGPAGSPYYGQPQQVSQTTQTDPIKAEQKKRAYLSLFASNVALTYRKGEAAEKLARSSGDPAQPDSSSTANDQSPVSQAQALRDAEALAAMGPPLPWSQPAQARHENSAAEKQRAPAGQQATKPETKAVNPDVAQPGEFNSASGKKYVLFEGTIIDTVLMNRLNGSFSGPVNCLVTHDVYSHDRQHVLIPAGTKVLGEADKVNAFGQQRLAVFFHRFIMPDGYSVNLDQFKGLDQLGATALHDKVNNHYVKIFGASLAVGLLGGVAEAGSGNVFTGSALDQARIGFGETMAMTGERIMDRFLNLMPTITIREGTRIKVYLSNDLLLPDYNQHTMPSDF
jgi:type IV secretory pathway VirB10-like protein